MPKLWVDDIRPAPDPSWSAVKTSEMAINILTAHKVTGYPLDIMSLDHDLGGDDTSRRIVLWCCENEWWPDEVVVHSQNPVGRDWLVSMVERYKP